MVGDVDEGDFEFAMQTHEFRLHAHTQMRVERAERLVQQQHLRLDDERTCERHALALTAGELVDRAIGQFSNAQSLQPFIGLCLSGSSRHAALLETELDVFAHREKRKERVVLPDERRFALPWLVFIEAAAPEANFACRRLVESSDHPQRCGLAATGRTHDRDEFAFID